MINIYEKIGNYGLDVSKYVLTGFVLASFFSNMEGGPFTMYMIGIGLAVLFFLLAMWAYIVQNKKENEKENKNKRNKGGKK